MTRRHSRFLLVGFAVLMSHACLSTPPGFGRRCATSDECEPSDLCVDQRCVPRRQVGDVGEDCRAPLPLGAGDGGTLLAVGEAALGAAKADLAATCAQGSPDVVFSVSIPEPMGLQIRAFVGDAPLPVSVRPWSDGSCGSEIVDGCEESGELLVARVDTGTYAIAVHGAASSPDAVVRVTVERLNCPLGYLPYDEGHCAGFREVAPLGIPRRDALLTALPDGRAIVTGGVESDGAPAPAGEIFDPSTESWTYVAFRNSQTNHAAVLAAGRFIVFGDDDIAERLVPASGTSGDSVENVYQFGSTHNRRYEDELLAAGLPSGKIALVFDDTTLLATAQEDVRRCQFDFDCATLDAVCVHSDAQMSTQGTCACGADPCLGPLTLNDEQLSIPGERPTQAASDRRAILSTQRGSTETVLVHGGSKLHELDVAAVLWRAVDVLMRDEAALTTVPGGALITGGRSVDQWLTAVERFDSDSRTLQRLPVELRTGRLHHGHAALLDGRVVIGGGVSSGGTPLDTAELLDPAGIASPRVPRLPASMGVVRAASLRDGRVLWVGAPTEDGLLSRAFLFEIVAPDYVPTSRSESNRCGPIVPLPLNATIEESTLGEADRFRDLGCGYVGDTNGPERLFSFSLDAPASITVEIDWPYAAVVLWRGTCAEHEVVGCGLDTISADSTSRLEISTLPAGDYVLVVEAHQWASSQTGVPFTLTTSTDAPRACLLDADDAADDTVQGARRMQLDPTTAPDEDDPLLYVATGAMCAGDVDNVIVDVWSGYYELSLADASSGDSTLSPAVFDDDASLAAGEPVFTFGAPQPFGRGSVRPGIYLATIRVPENDPFQHHWSLRNSEGGCRPDDVDSLAPVLDDGDNPRRRVRLVHGEPLLRCATSELDLDVVVFQRDPDAHARLSLTGVLSSQMELQLFSLTAPDAPLGTPFPDSLEEEGGLLLDPGTGWVAARITSKYSGGQSYWITVAIEQPGDSCLDPLPFADSGSLLYDSGNYVNDYSPEVLGNCTGWPAFGEDIVGALTLAEGDRITARLNPTGEAEVSLYLLGACTEDDSACVAGADEYGGGLPEDIEYTHVGTARTFFIVADSYEDAPYSAELTWNVTRAGP